MNNQLCFQRTNENLRDCAFITEYTPDGTNTVDYPATNTVKSATTNDHNIQFNQLFNHVNYIKSIEIKPGHTEFVIIAFLPDQPNEVEQLHLPDTFDFKEVNGLIFLLCYKIEPGFDKSIPEAPPDFQVHYC